MQTTNLQPSPTSASPELALTAVTALRNELSIRFEAVQTRFEAMDKAATILHEDNTRVPTQIDIAIRAVRELLEARLHEHDRVLTALQSQLDTRVAGMWKQFDERLDVLRDQVSSRAPAVREIVSALQDVLTQAIGKEVATLDGRVNVVIATSEEQLKSVQMQFLLLKQATEQLDIANKTAIAAALQAQKESAGETQKTSQAAIAKSEASTSEAIKALTTTFNVAITSLGDRFLDLKGRLDRGEGRSTAADPALVTMYEQVRDLSKSRDSTSGMGYMVVTGFAVLTSLIMAGIAVFHVIK